MIGHMFRRTGLAKLAVWVVLVAAGGVLLTASPAMARQDDDDGSRPVVDARLEGMTADGNSVVDLTKPISDRSALTWFVFAAFAVLAAGGLFKDSRRTHLD